MNRWRRLWQSGRAWVPDRNPVAPWCLLFLFVNFVSWSDGGTNPASRFAAARAMSRHRTFSIDRYQYWTVDRSQAPDGTYYSNKAPGAAMLAVPVSIVLDGLGFPTNDDSRGGRSRATLAYKTAVCFVVQGVPFALAVFLVAGELRRRAVPPAALHYAALAALFGNTAALFVNVFFGHVVTAWLLMAVVLAALRAAPTLMGLAFGFALLSDYAVAALVIPFAGAVFLEAPAGMSRAAKARRVAAGGALPAALWIWYHTACFGGPFVTALHHQSAMFTDPSQVAGTLRAVLAPLARLAIVRELLLGASRGILPTQPWVFVAYGLAVWAIVRGRGGALPPILLWLLLPGLPLLVWLNAGFSGWHAGWSAGPRYLSPLFPLFGILGAFCYSAAGRWGRAGLWAALLVALTLRALVFATGHPLLRGLVPVWEYYGRESIAHGGKLAVFGVAFLLTTLVVIRSSRSE